MRKSLGILVGPTPKMMKPKGITVKRPPKIPQSKYFNGEEYDLLYLGKGTGPEDGYATKAQAQKNATEWRESGEDCLARVVKIHDHYYVYGR